MSHLSQIEIPTLASFALSITPPNAVTMSGTIAIPDPGLVLGGTIRALHEAALSDHLQELSVDVRGLTFVNSSAIRLFVDWATWVKNESTHRYKLRFLTSRHITWQKTSFTALKSLMDGILSFDGVD